MMQIGLWGVTMMLRRRVPAYAPTFHKHTLRQKYRQQFIEKYGNHHDFAQFKWQDSFHDHLIRDAQDFYNHVEYIRNQWIKHNLPSNKYCFIDEELCREMYE